MRSEIVRIRYLIGEQALCWLRAAGAAADDSSWRNVVIDVVFVLLTVGLFAALGLLVRAVERL